jgi:thioredoxin 1
MAGNVTEITDKNWQSEVMDSRIPVLVDFWAPWCGPCRMLAPTIEKLANEYAGKVKVGKMDTDTNTDIPPTLGISGIPTVILYQNGKEVSRIVGLQPEAKFKDALAKIGVN